MNRTPTVKNGFVRLAIGLCLFFSHAIITSATSAVASEAVFAVGIQVDRPSVPLNTSQGQKIVQRIQDQEHRISGEFAKTSRPCPPFCIQPMQVADGVKTIGELELLDALERPDTVVIDSRSIDWYLEGTIPGAVHIAYTEVAGRLDELGCVKKEGDWNCEDAMLVALFCNGPWCGQSPIAIRAMLREGYPAERISYYRGGMQLWNVLGLTVVEGDF